MAKKTAPKKPKKEAVKKAADVGDESLKAQVGGREVGQIPYRNIPALAHYIDRIGAEQLNFRRFMVKEEKGKYYTERTIVRINPDGTIYCSNKEHAPSEEEATLIRGALMAVGFPKSIVASEAQYKVLASKLSGTKLFPAYSRGKVNGILMVQQRVDKDGTKHYIPWTMWSDGVWRAMEPDGPLPFYKGPERTSAKIMVHEGAKAAEAASRIANDPKHPWCKRLSQYEHWGILGGALAPHRADYSELENHKPTEVVYVCDNDEPGRSVLEKFSQYWGKSLLGLSFDKRFPYGFDMADDLPDTFYKMGEEFQEYVGPDIDDLLKPATWATRMIDPQEGDEDAIGRKRPVLKDNFASEWNHSIAPEYFIHRRWPLKLYNEQDFRSLVAPFTHRCDIAGLIRASDGGKVEGIDYRPDLAPGVYVLDKKRVINTCPPLDVEEVEGDYSPLVEYFERLVPSEGDRLELMRWCATLIARPDIRMTYSVLMVSEAHGVGKTTLGEKILAPILGRGNVSFPREKDICESDFNGWMVRKRLVVVNEIYAGNSSRAYNNLKSVVADSYVTVNEKFVPTYTLQNWAHVIASSNSMRALKIDAEDRRWLVPKITEELSPPAYWVKLNHWLENEKGLGKTIHWAKEFLKKNTPVKSGTHAPITEAKREVIDEGLSRGQAAIRDILKRVEEDGYAKGVKPIITDTQLIDYITQTLYQGRYNDKIERPLTARKIGKGLGWHCGDRNNGCPAMNMPPFRSRIMSMDPKLARMTPTQLHNLGHKFWDLGQYNSF